MADLTLQQKLRKWAYPLMAEAADRIDEVEFQLGKAHAERDLHIRAGDLMEQEIVKLQAEIERLKGLVPRPDQTPDEILWRDHLRGVSLAQLAKDAGCTKERIRHRLNKMHTRKHDSAVEAIRLIASHPVEQSEQWEAGCMEMLRFARNFIARHNL